VIIQGGEHARTANILAYTRTQESAADQAAARLLDATGESSKGLLDFLEKLSDQELLSARHQNPYLRTHPLTHDRIVFMRNHVKESPYSDVPIPPELVEKHRRMVAKLRAFLEPAEWTFRRYKEDDQSIEARYARAIAYHRLGKVDDAIKLLDGLLAEHPNDPYFYELKGQILFEGGRPRDALPAYQKATALLPKASLILTDLARVQLALEDPAMLPDAIDVLRKAVRIDPQYSFAWRQLAIAYGRNGDMKQSTLALAEEAYLQGRWQDAIHHAGKVASEFPRGSREWLRAEDIRSQAERELKNSKDG
jgi:predicted Zn-dependent protease